MFHCIPQHPLKCLPTNGSCQTAAYYTFPSILFRFSVSTFLLSILTSSTGFKHTVYLLFLSILQSVQHSFQNVLLAHSQPALCFCLSSQSVNSSPSTPACPGQKIEVNSLTWGHSNRFTKSLRRTFFCHL